MTSTYSNSAEFLELSARERTAALLGVDRPSVELLGPFDRIASPWLELSGRVAQADDGVVVTRGWMAQEQVVVVAIEASFEGGSIGEIGGAKIATALQLAAEASRAGRRTPAILLLETGGVRLNEANLGLAAIADIQRGILGLRRLAPVVAVVAGPVGCFGGMSLAAALCTHIIGTRYARYGMNGPEVIEQEAGADELNADDRAKVWSIFGCESRLQAGWIDAIVPANSDAIRTAVTQALEGSLSHAARPDAETQRAMLRSSWEGLDADIR